MLAAKRSELAAARRALRESEDEALKQLVLAPPPTELVRLIFLLLPVDARLRCREVCRGWRLFLADSFLWRVCNLSTTSGVMAERTPALLEAACACAQGTLEMLDVTGWRGLFNRLRVLECDAGSTEVDAANTLRLLEEPQFEIVRLQTLYLEPHSLPLVVPEVAARLASHSSLLHLTLWNVALDTDPALDAVVDLAISQLRHLCMADCLLSPDDSLPALTRMLGSGNLKDLCIYNSREPLLLGAFVPAFCAALRASRLVKLKLVSMCLWQSLEDGLALIASCTGHPTLRALDFHDNDLGVSPGREAIEAALDALAATNAELHIRRALAPFAFQ